MITATMEERIIAYKVLKRLVELNYKGHVAFKIAKFMKQMQSDIDLYQNARKNIIKCYCLKDDQGEPIADANGEFQFESNEDQKNCENELISLLDEEYSSDLEPLQIDWFSEVYLTPQEADCLEKFI